MLPPIKGINNKKIFTLRNINDMDKIKREVAVQGVKNAVVVGGGYVGVETAEKSTAYRNKYYTHRSSSKYIGTI